jgi:hypothetical protein
MNIPEIAQAMRQAAQFFDWEREFIGDFHEYAQMFGGDPGCNVFEFALKDALKSRGLTLEQFREKAKEKI